MLLNMLLDKFENSALYKGTPGSNRRVWLRVNRRTFPPYFDDTTARHKERLNEGARLLEDRGFIEIVWEKFEEGNLIRKMALTTERVNEAYQFLQRRPRAAKEREVAGLAETYARGSAEWVQQFLGVIAERVRRGESVARYLDLDNPERTDALFRALRGAGRLEGEIPRRVFSQRVLGATKAFDTVAGTVARVAAEFCPRFRGTGADLEPDEILAELGIVDNPQHIFISGSLRFTVGHGSVDLSHFQPDLGISTEMIGRMSITALPADHVVTVENLTAYYSFIKSAPAGCLTLYLGGYHNSLRRAFLGKVRDYARDSGRQINFWHWGDIDYGGFRIFVHLRDNCLPDLQPLHMDTATLVKYRAYGLPFGKPYAAKLRRLAGDERYRIFHPVISHMLEHNICLEQECVTEGAEGIS